jgi:hypothetical protein
MGDLVALTEGDARKAVDEDHGAATMNWGR